MPSESTFPVQNYDLGATLSSGQAFRWNRCGEEWEGVIGRHAVALRADGQFIHARSAVDEPGWSGVAEYLQCAVRIDEITATFPDDPPMRAAIDACRGLRLLRQEPWECLASFILSSTKQIVQIRQIVRSLCECFGNPIPFAPNFPMFPTADRLAGLTESSLRSCKMGFRAPYLLETAQIVASGKLNLESLRAHSTTEARAQLVALPGVGEKIANCVLLFAYGFQDAFPIDVWIQKALVSLYFPKRKPSPERLRRFVGSHFGPNAGYAQQYLFHYMRTRPNPASTPPLP